MKFNTQYNIVEHSKPESFEGIISKVDLIGYIPKERQIQMLIEAGERLQASRGVYDLKAGQEFDIDDLDCDPTRDLAFGLAEASEIMRRYQISQVFLETGDFIDMKGNRRNIRDLGSVKELPRPDSTPRSVSGQMTPSGEEVSKNVQKAKNIKKEVQDQIDEGDVTGGEE